MPFWQEYDNEAETLVSGLQFSYDDEDVEVGRIINGKRQTMTKIILKLTC